MSTASPEPEPIAGAGMVKAFRIKEMPDEERRCDICGRIPLARKGCYAAFVLGFVYVEACRRCAALVKRAVGALP